MKKMARYILILILVLGISVFMGFEEFLVKDEASKNNIAESVVEYDKQHTQNEQKTNEDFITEAVPIEETNSGESKKQIIATTESFATELLSAEDKAVKEEIAKFRETDVDFRYNKQEKIKGKTFDIVFSEIEYANDYKRVLYKNSFGDEFAYNTDNGRLRYAVMESAITPKTIGSINLSSAQQIACEYVSSYCDIDKYTIEQSKEIDDGYYFCFTKYIGGYPSVDRYGIQIGYNGDVVYLSDTTDVFTDKNIDFDKSFIDSKIKEHSDEAKVDWESVKICIEEEKVSVSYTIPEQYAIAVLPLE